MLVVHHVFRPDDTFQTLDVGSLLPLHACALGKVLLAFGPTPVEPVLRGGAGAVHPAHARRPGPTLHRALAEIREPGGPPRSRK